MSSHPSYDILAGLETGRRTGQRIRSAGAVVVANNQVLPILNLDEDSFTLRACDAKGLRGLVHIKNGGQTVCEGLILASEKHGDNVRFTIKRTDPVVENGALDFLRAEIESAGGLREVA